MINFIFEHPKVAIMIAFWLILTICALVGTITGFSGNNSTIYPVGMYDRDQFREKVEAVSKIKFINSKFGSDVEHLEEQINAWEEAALFGGDEYGLKVIAIIDLLEEAKHSLISRNAVYTPHQLSPQSSRAFYSYSDRKRYERNDASCDRSYDRKQKYNEDADKSIHQAKVLIKEMCLEIKS